MAKCDICGKGIGFGKKYSHSHIRTNRQWKPNIQRVRAIVDGTPKDLRFAAACVQEKYKGHLCYLTRERGLFPSLFHSIISAIGIW